MALKVIPSELTISIHAPSRERRTIDSLFTFNLNFNPRSLAGATIICFYIIICLGISIHAPSRERHSSGLSCSPHIFYFNPRSLAGATTSRRLIELLRFNFNPRSLAGATLHKSLLVPCRVKFQSTLPRGSDAYAA